MIRALEPPAYATEKSLPTLIALVRLLARQAAREALAETNANHEQNQGLPVNPSGGEDGS